MKSVKILMTFLMVFIVSGIQACQLTITNDKKEPYMIMAWGTGTAIYLKPGQTEAITSRIVDNEKESKLYFFQGADKKLSQKYTVIQRGCAEDKGEKKLKISQVEQMIDKPTARIKVIPYKGESTIMQWWNALSKKVQNWFGSKEAEQNKIMPAKPNAETKTNGSLKAAEEKCNAKPAEQHEQCFFDVAKTIPGDVLPTGNYE